MGLIEEKTAQKIYIYLRSCRGKIIEIEKEFLFNKDEINLSLVIQP